MIQGNLANLAAWCFVRPSEPEQVPDIIRQWMDLRAELAADIEKHWNATIGKPLRFVGGDPQLAYGVAAYLSDQPLPYVYDRVTPTIERSEVDKHGIVLLCVETHATDCREDLKSFEKDTQIWTVSLARRFGGFTGPPKGYYIASIPPRSNERKRR